MCWGFWLPSCYIIYVWAFKKGQRSFFHLSHVWNCRTFNNSLHHHTSDQTRKKGGLFKNVSSIFAGQNNNSDCKYCNLSEEYKCHNHRGRGKHENTILVPAINFCLFKEVVWDKQRIPPKFQTLYPSFYNNVRLQSGKYWVCDLYSFVLEWE